MPTSDDPMTCRRALREIAEIAAVARLQDSRMTGQEALDAIAAIAGWAVEAAPRAEAECSGIIARIDALTGGVDPGALDDRSALRLFSTVTEALRGVR